jgi:predicted ArsR family transcriptional regulator
MPRQKGKLDIRQILDSEPNEHKILMCLLRNYDAISLREIASQVHLSTDTVKTHLLPLLKQRKVVKVRHGAYDFWRIAPIRARDISETETLKPNLLFELAKDVGTKVRKLHGGKIPTANPERFDDPKRVRQLNQGLADYLRRRSVRPN